MNSTTTITVVKPFGAAVGSASRNYDLDHQSERRADDGEQGEER